jgi:hypothetical protein
MVRINVVFPGDPPSEAGPARAGLRYAEAA